MGQDFIWSSDIVVIIITFNDSYTASSTCIPGIAREYHYLIVKWRAVVVCIPHTLYSHYPLVSQDTRECEPIPIG